jgi:CheY-like chemotaxis protein
MTQSICKLLLVDDETSILDALQRTHRKRYDIAVATSGAEGLATLETKGPFDVVVSDYQMPEMNGVAFLTQVASRAPDCVRMMLTGNADLKTAIDAVNTGRVFRFLTKPCDPAVFVSGVDAALEQSRLRRAERELLEGTLKGSIEVLSEVLSLANPDAFGRSNRIRHYVSQLVALLGLPDAWQVESAASLSQIGCVALPGDIVESVVLGRKLTEQQARAYDHHPEIGAKLLERIPRLGEVAEIVSRQRKTAQELGKEPGLAPSVSRGSQILAACLEFDELTTLGATGARALAAMGSRQGAYSPDVLNAMKSMHPMREGAIAKDVYVVELQDGMILGQDVRSKNDTLIVASGQRVTRSMIERLRNYHHLRGVREPIRILIVNEEHGKAAA